MSNNDDTEDDDSGVSREAILTALGIGGGVWAALSDFGSELAEADSLRELILGVILESLVSAGLSLVEYLYAEALYAIDLVAASFWMSFVEPFGDLYDAYTAALISPLEGLRVTVESAASSAGLAAPFVALAGWVAVLLVVAVIVGIVWAFVETYLPIEAVTRTGARLRDLALVPFGVLRDFVSGLSRAGTGGNDGGTDEN
ncbi:hypothetical protein [Halorubrum sp. F4]|uniref:hypothetical protein n=1 Tax=Halorubrum sp. F4 TaxID=2989715 RepID=UPI00248071B4|nr:hypothetical protein [Halorubrum sp. F4]